MLLTLMLAVSCGTGSELSSTEGALGKSGDYAALIVPSSSLTYSLGKHDNKASLQFTESYAAAMIATYTLKHFVHRCRPDGSNDKSFPSGHTTSIFSAAWFLQRQYGSKIGVPALAVASYVGWTRVKTKRHWLTDVLVGAAISTAANFALVHPERNGHRAPDSVRLGREGDSGIPPSFVHRVNN